MIHDRGVFAIFYGLLQNEILCSLLFFCIGSLSHPSEGLFWFEGNNFGGVPSGAGAQGPL